MSWGSGTGVDAEVMVRRVEKWDMLRIGTRGGSGSGSNLGLGAYICLGESPLLDCVCVVAGDDDSDSDEGGDDDAMLGLGYQLEEL